MTADRFVASSTLGAPAERLYDWHLRPGAFERLVPPWERVRVVSRTGPPAEGSKVELRVSAGPLHSRWVAVHRGFEPGRQFTDVQERGPFARWAHTHRAVPDGERRSILQDEIEYALPFGALGRLAGRRFVRRQLTRMFTYRHAVTAADLERHGSVAERPSLHVAVSGASGMVGSALVAFLSSGGHRVSRLVRREAADSTEISWDPASGRLDAARLEGVDAVVNLAGENVASSRWNAERKAAIRDSRVTGARSIAEALAGLSRPPRVLVNASAIGYYGDRDDEELDEDSAPGEGFLAETCRAWEAATGSAREAGMRVVLLRIGIVLSARGGALARMLPLFRLGLGGKLGHGRQFMSWIALDDLVGVVHHALFEESLSGPVNAVAPTPVRNAEFTRTLGRVLRRPTMLPAPGPMIRLALGQMGQELLLAGARVVPRRLLDSGFRFRFPGLERALRFELGRYDPSWPRPRIRHG